MIDKLQLSLYELFGYLLPGSVMTVAGAIFFWTMSLPEMPLPAYKIRPNVIGWSLFAAISYILGHIVQGIGNWTLRGVENLAVGPNGTVPARLVREARNELRNRFGIEAEALSPVSLFRLADETSVQAGAIVDRDVFIYREGFYRGATIALSFLAIALLLRGAIGHPAIRLPQYTFYFSRAQIEATAFACAGCAYVSKARFFRFGQYRVDRALVAFLVSSRKPVKEEE